MKAINALIVLVFSLTLLTGCDSLLNSGAPDDGAMMEDKAVQDDAMMDDDSAMMDDSASADDSAMMDDSSAQ